MARKIFISVFCLILVYSHSTGQDSLSIVEAEQMKYRAKNIITDELMQLLNSITSSDFSTSEVKTIITNSHSGADHKIFASPKVIIEDDIDPTFKSSQTTRDADVDKYLTDLDVLYTKSTSSSIIFTNVRASNPKKGAENYIFIKVYFNSFFRNQNLTVEKAYTLNNRVALVRMDKIKDKWTPIINSITFFNPEDTLNDVANDIRVYNDKAQNLAANGSTDSAAIANSIKQLIEEEKAKEQRKLEEEEKQKNQQWYAMIEKGDKAVDNKNFIDALKLYKEAKDLRPYDPLPKKKILHVNSLQQENELNNEKLYEGYIRAAVLAEKKRNFQVASMNLKKALDLKPENASTLVPKIKDLDARWGTVANLEEKFAAGVNFKSLVEEYDKAIKKNKTNSDLFLGRARCYEKLNSPGKAKADYTRAIELDANNIAALKMRAALLTKMNAPFDALSDYKLYLTNYDEDFEIYDLMADLRLQIKPDNIQGALDDIEAGLKKNNKSAPLLFKKGLLLSQKNDYKNAISSFDAAIANDSTAALSYYHRGRNQLALNNVTNASIDFASARQKGLDSQLVRNIETYAQSFYKRAVSAFSADDKDSAVTLIDFAISIDPANPDYHFTRGTYFLSASNYNAAISSLNRAIQLNPDFTEAYNKRGFAYYNLENYKIAAENFTNSLELDKKHLQAKKGLADSYFALKDYKTAAETYESFLQIVNSLKNPSSATNVANAFNSMGKSYFILNEPDERALRAFNSAIRKDPGYAEAYFNRGLYHYKKNELSDAIADIGKAISLDNKHASWNYYLGKAYQDKKDFQNAANFYSSTIVKDSLKNFPETLYLLANSNYQLQNYPEALANYQKMLELNLDTSVTTFCYEIGNTMLNLNKADSALEFLNKAYETDSTNGNVAYSIAKAKLISGKNDESLSWFEKAFQSKQLSEGLVKRDKSIGALKDDKRFKALIKKYF